MENAHKVLSNKGITLIALVITIIILLILAGIAISQLTQSGLFDKARKAENETKVANYKEQIELVKMELIMWDKGNYPTLSRMKEEFDTKHTKWVANTEIITDNEIEKLQLITNEKYVFFITATTTEFKGYDGKVVDTTALKRDDVIEFEIVEEGNSVSKVKITDKSGVEYYRLKYQIGSTEGEWIEIESGDIVQVPYGTTIHAKLQYGSDSGQIHHKAISDSEPEVVAKDIDLSNTARKTDKSLAELFEITWGSSGQEKIEYSVTGNLTFNNTNFSSTEIENISELELGTYTITCKVTSKANQVAEATKENVKITTLAETTVTNASNTEVTAKAIYSEYDLAYFRDFVNGGQNTINAKVMKDLDLSNVSYKVDGTTAKDLSFASIGNSTNKFKGIFDGNQKKIDKIYINSASSGIGLFGYIENATIQNIVLGTGTITGGNRVGGTVGYAKNSTIKQITNNGTQVASSTTYKETGNCMYLFDMSAPMAYEFQASSMGGICGKAEDTSIANCTNKVAITTDNATGGSIGGIVGYSVSFNGNTINQCENKGTITEDAKYTGGIVGLTYGNVIIQFCSNEASINSSNSDAGGIAGAVVGGAIKTSTNNKSITGTYDVGGIVGGVFGKNTEDIVTISYNSNSGTIVSNGKNTANFTGSGSTWSYDFANVGGIVGLGINIEITNCSNTQSVNATIVDGIICDVGGIIGEFRNGTVTNSYNTASIGNDEMLLRCVGGIAGMASYNSKINNCYNTGEVKGEFGIAGICGYAAQLDLRYCYNRGTVKVTNSDVGGICGTIQPYQSASYENNNIYYCYNTGGVSGSTNKGVICGNASYCNIDYIYSYGPFSQFGTKSNVIGLENTGTGAQSNLVSAVLSKFGTNFKSDYEGTDSINDGYPILSWQ